MSLYLFTMLGGLAAGTYAFETCFVRNRKGERPWLTPLVVVALFVIGLIAAVTHLGNAGRAVSAVFSGFINFGAGMTQEVIIAGIFLVLAIVDLLITFAKKNSPYALRVITAVFAVACIAIMGFAYVEVLGVPVWTNAPTTLAAFIFGDLAMGLALFALLNSKNYGDQKNLRITSLVINALLAVALLGAISVFAAEGEDIMAQVAGLIIAPVVSLITVAAAPKLKGSAAASIICVASIIGVAVARYAFYALCPVL